MPNETLEIKASVPTPTGMWHHVAATYDRKRMRLYLDGNEVAGMDYTGELVPSRSPLFIGTNKNDGAPAQAFDGVLDDVVIYSDAQPIEVIRSLRDGTM